MKLCILISIIITIIIILVNNKKENFNSQCNCKKQIDNTCIKLIQHKWSDDFKHRFQHHEPKSNMKLKQLLKELPNNSYIIDVGSHVGDTGLYLALILKNHYNSKNIKVIMIDPDSSKIEFINLMAKHNNLHNILLMNYGVSDTPGNGILDKKLHPGGWQINTNNKGDIKLDTIDNLCRDKHISLLHIDVEGMEYKCLLGSQQTIKNVKYIMIELNGIKQRSEERELLIKNEFHEIQSFQKENGNYLFKNKLLQ